MSNNTSVGLITIHNINNFGSALQTFATSYIVEKLGYKCHVINYKYPNEGNIISSDKTNSTFSIRSSLFVPFLGFIKSKSNSQKIKRFSLFFDENLRMTEEFSNRDDLKGYHFDFDIFITGSDQVWNPKYCGDDTTFLLSFVNDNCKKIAYASSFGAKEFSEKYEKLYEKYLKMYSFISVREISGIDIVRKLTKKTSKHVLDPTLLLNSNDWSKLIKNFTFKSNPYILCYILSYTFNPFPYAHQLVDHIKKLTGYEVIWIDGPFINKFKYGYKNFSGLGPIEFLGLVKNSSFIITSSFHGTAFSLNFNKPFYSIVNHEKTTDDRQLSLLRMLNIEERAIHKNCKLPQKEDLNLNFDSINEKLMELKSESINFLENALLSCSNELQKKE